jgi:hypothetical protein
VFGSASNFHRLSVRDHPRNTFPVPRQNAVPHTRYAHNLVPFAEAHAFPTAAIRFTDTLRAAGPRERCSIVPYRDWLNRYVFALRLTITISFIQSTLPSSARSFRNSTSLCTFVEGFSRSGNLHPRSFQYRSSLLAFRIAVCWFSLTFS